MTTLINMLDETKAAFAANHIKASVLEAKTLLTGLFELTLLDLAIRQDLILSNEQVKCARSAIKERLEGKPVYRILGWREFYGLRFKLSKDTLEPRPDTETLVDAVIPFVKEFSRPDKDCTIVDLGTGSGAIALAILQTSSNTIALGTDHSEGALAIAQLNAKQLGLGDRFTVLKSNWTSQIKDKFDVVLSNPPYIATAELSELSVEVLKHDPLLALDGGEDGLDAYRILSVNIPAILNPNGIVALEIGWKQANSVSKIFADRGFKRIKKYTDLSGYDRVLLFKYK